MQAQHPADVDAIGAADMAAICAQQVGQQQVIAFQNALAQVQRPCGDGRISKARKKTTGNGGKRLLLQNNNSQNSNDAVGPGLLYQPLDHAHKCSNL